MPSLSFGLLEDIIGKFGDLKAVLGIGDGNLLFLLFSNEYINLYHESGIRMREGIREKHRHFSCFGRTFLFITSFFHGNT